jgi:hypothetical protein
MVYKPWEKASARLAFLAFSQQHSTTAAVHPLMFTKVSLFKCPKGCQSPFFCFGASGRAARDGKSPLPKTFVLK